MLDIIKESFRITNENIIIATPLILFSLISSLYLIFSYSGNSIGIITSVILFFLMLAAFLSGWFYMIAKAVKNSELQNNFITEFPTGVGEYFLSVLGMIFKIMIITTVIVIFAYICGKKFIGGIGVSYNQIVQAAASIEAMKDFVNNLNNEQLIKINAWNILFFCSMVLNYFILMLYPAAIFFKRKNPFVAFWISLKDTFGHRFFKNLLLFLIIFTSYMIISALTAFFGKNIFVHFILTLINFYYLTFVGILVFNYYYSNFAKIGSAIDTTV